MTSRSRHSWMLAPAFCALAFLNVAPPSARAADTTKEETKTTTKEPKQAGDHHIHFAHQAARGGMMEVTLGKLAEEKAASPDVKKFGARMVADHSKANAELEEIMKAKKIDPIPLSPKQKEMMAHLESLSGAAFDKAYVEHMVKDHKEDVTEFTQQAENGKDPEIKAFAAKTLPVLKEHLQMIEAISAKMGTGNSK